MSWGIELKYTYIYKTKGVVGWDSLHKHKQHTHTATEKREKAPIRIRAQWCQLLCNNKSLSVYTEPGNDYENDDAIVRNGRSYSKFFVI